MVAPECQERTPALLKSGIRCNNPSVLGGGLNRLRQMRPVLDFVVPYSRNRLDQGFGRILEAVGVSQSREDAQQLSIEGATLGDWWLARVSGKGSMRLHGALPRQALSDRAMLTLVTSGNIKTEGSHEYFGRPSEISLARWNSFDDVVFDGTFEYLTIYVPVSDLERVGNMFVPYDRFIPAFTGPGAFTASTLKSWVGEVLAGRDTRSMEKFREDLLRLVLTALSNSDSSNSSEETAAAKRVSRVHEYLKRHLSDCEINPAQVARECGVSERQLYRDFALTGEKFSCALRRFRLEEAAARLLRQKDSHITDISYACGFQNSAHFSRAFRQAYGETPREFRNKFWNNRDVRSTAS